MEVIKRSKRALYAVLLFISIVSVTATATAQSGLVAAYSFGQGSGTTVPDSSGNNLTGTIVGASWTTTGKYGSALSFNGSSSYVDLGNPAALQLTGSMTLEAWVNAAANPADDGQIIAKSDEFGWQLKTSPDTGPHTFGIAVSSNGVSAHTQRYSATTRSLSTWYHVAGVYNASAGTLNVYVNGVLNNNTLIGTIPSSQFNAIVNANIGRRTGGYYFNGVIDEVRIYNRALSQAEIQTDMNTPIGSVSSPVAPAITSQPVSQTITAGQTASFSVAATGTAPLTYQWKKNNVSISGATSSSYTTPAATTADNGTQFTVTVSNAVSSVNSNIATLTVTAATVAPSITSQPASQTITAGQTASFSVAATGTAALTYQWKKNNVSISGATASSYTTPAATTADNGAQFTVTVSNAVGSVNSNIATLTVTAATVAPSITSQPVSQTITAGQTASFSVAATGTAPLTYQWKKNNVSISGATSASYTTPAATTADNGTQFTVTVSNAVSSVNSNIATLTVTAATVAPSITSQPASQTITAGQTASFSVAATGTAALTYQWKKNNVSISGATASSYTTPAATTADNGAQFTVTVSNAVGSVNSNSATLTVTTTVASGLVAAYSFGQGSGTTVPDSSGNNLTGTIVGASWTTTGKYGSALSFNGSSSYVDLGNPAALQLTGSMTLEAWVNAAANPADDGQIIAKSDEFGWQLKTSPDTGPHTFGIAVSSNGVSAHTQRYSATTRSLSTWYHVAGVYNASAGTLNVYVNGVLNNNTLIGTIPSSQFNAIVNANIGRRTGGYYFNGVIDEVRIYNRALSQAEIQTDMNTPIGSVSSPVAPAITSQPVSQTITAGQTASFSVAATGTAPLTYQWKKNNVSISGATSSSYTTPAATTADNGTQFTVTVSNAVSSVTSSTATLTVNVAGSGLLISSLNLNFGNVNVGSSKNLTATLTNSSSSSIVVLGISIGGAGFTLSGIPTGLILNVGSTATLNATFAPAASGPVTGSVVITSTAPNPILTINLTGTGVQVIPHTVTLNWNPSTSTVSGYYVYRSTVSGSSYVQLNSSLVTATQFADTTVQSGQTYYYVVTSMNSSNAQSAYSSQVSATIP